MSPTLTAPVYRTIKLKDEANRTITFKLTLSLEDGLFIQGPGDKKARGPLRIQDAYVACCQAEAKR